MRAVVRKKVRRLKSSGSVGLDLVAKSLAPNHRSSSSLTAPKHKNARKDMNSQTCVRDTIVGMGAMRGKRRVPTRRSRKLKMSSTKAVANRPRTISRSHLERNLSETRQRDRNQKR